jgi:hypothetical protein
VLFTLCPPFLKPFLTGFPRRDSTLIMQLLKDNLSLWSEQADSEEQ